MKFILFALITLVSASSFASPDPVGTYKNKHKFFAQMYENKTACKADHGHWLKEESVCEFTTSDTAEVTREGNQFSLAVTTLESNFHTCEFQGPATLSGNTLVSKAEAEDYNPETGQIETVECRVSAELSSRGKSMSITTNGKCQSYCGANGTLEVELRKVRRSLFKRN